MWNVFTNNELLKANSKNRVPNIKCFKERIHCKYVSDIRHKFQLNEQWKVAFKILANLSSFGFWVEVNLEVFFKKERKKERVRGGERERERDTRRYESCVCLFKMKELITETNSNKLIWEFFFFFLFCKFEMQLVFEIENYPSQV